MNPLEQHIQEITALCDIHKVNRLYAFGSIVGNQFNPQSDIDLIVDFNPMDATQYADNYFDFKFSLQKLLNRRIDLLEEQAIKNPFFLKFINLQKKLVYGS